MTTHSHSGMKTITLNMTTSLSNAVHCRDVVVLSYLPNGSVQTLLTNAAKHNTAEYAYSVACEIDRLEAQEKQQEADVQKAAAAVKQAVAALERATRQLAVTHTDLLRMQKRLAEALPQSLS